MFTPTLIVTDILHCKRRVLLEIRRSRSDLEAAREAFHRARAEFTDILDVWQAGEELRLLEYHRQLGQRSQRLRDIGNQCVLKALDETRKSMLELVWLSLHSDNVIYSLNLQFSLGNTCGSDTESGASLGVFVGSRQESELLFCRSQEKLSALLGKLRYEFVSIVRELADQASSERIQSLRNAIKALENGIESDLRSEILIDLESLNVSVRTLAFQSYQKALKTERER